MWFTSLFRRPKPKQARVGRIASLGNRRWSFAPRLECLEDRTVPSTMTVTNNADSGAGSLRDAITNAKSGDAIVFASSLNGQTITLTSGELALSKSLDIEGPGASLLAISGNSASRVFDISQNQTPVTVTIAGLTIENGLSPDGEGGAIDNVSSTLNLTNDVLSNNVARGNSGTDGAGGAVFNFNGATLTVSNCTFSGNQAIGGEGGSHGQGRGGAIALFLSAAGSGPNGCTATISGSLFTGNLAQGGNGVTITKFGFPGNGFGGAINSLGYGVSNILTVQGCTFIGNQAIGGSNGSGPKSDTTVKGFDLDAGLGGGIDTYATTLTVSNSTFSYNQAVGGSNCTALFGKGHLGDGAGGAIHTITNAVNRITNSTFDHNLAQGGSNNTGGRNVFIVGWGHGGAITNDAWPDLVLSGSFTGSGLTFTNNQAIGGAGNTGAPLAGDGIGGALDNWAAGVLTLSNSIMRNNQAIGGAGVAGQNGADGLGGGIANLLGATFTASNCTMTGNQAIGGAGGSGANGGNGFGGGLYNQGNSLFGTSSLTISGSTVTGNSATGGAGGSGGSVGQGIGGGAYFASGGVVCLDLFTSMNITGNTASTSNNDMFGVFTICP